ncbi:hypothetical protein E3Q18_00603 [Wallemia mellicola]|nr:hypothetical protein E3Q18_00603 [Wallemia mellicola]
MTNDEFEIALFRAVIKARPVGLNRHFHFLSVQQSMTTELGHEVELADIKRKLASLYDLDGLDSQDLAEDDFLSSVEQFELPHDSDFIELCQQRAFRPAKDRATPPSSPIISPSEEDDSSLSEAEDTTEEPQPVQTRRRSSAARSLKHEDSDLQEDDAQITNDDNEVDEEETNTRSSRSRTAKAAADAPKRGRGGRPAKRGRTSSTRSATKKRESLPYSLRILIIHRLIHD